MRTLWAWLTRRRDRTGVVFEGKAGPILGPNSGIRDAEQAARIGRIFRGMRP